MWICAALTATLLVTKVSTGVSAYALWSVIWCLCAYAIASQMLPSLCLFASGLCYPFAYMAGLPVGEGISILTDGLGVLALALLGGRIIADRTGSAGFFRVLSAAYPWAVHRR